MTDAAMTHHLLNNYSVIFAEIPLSIFRGLIYQAAWAAVRL